MRSKLIYPQTISEAKRIIDFLERSLSKAKLIRGKKKMSHQIKIIKDAALSLREEARRNRVESMADMSDSYNFNRKFCNSISIFLTRVNNE